ncbi:MAG: cytochrome o ubiquinol oxidase subunit [Candidatus Saccharibacteria bacterium]|nr:cytochrome o ubiquinol oxidase subunit [Candidatus Saccharibacteria bacterium]
MTNQHHSTQPKTKVAHSGIWSYVIGFVLAVTLTLLAYVIVVNHLATGFTLLATLLGLAAVQLLVQLVFFLHLGRDKNSRWNVASFYFMLLVLVIFVGGSLWIMSNLNYNMMMSPEEMNKFMLDQSMRGF